MIISNAVALYFNERAEYLASDISVIDTAVSAITEDEFKHLQAMQQAGVERLCFEVSISEINCYESYVEVIATETVDYKMNGEYCENSISHILLLAPNENNSLIVASDSYFDSSSDFMSCSYVPTDNGVMMLSGETTAAGSSMCLLHIAANEIGYIETGDNQTKYNDWIGVQGGWCAMFIAWCADQASISTSVIPCTGGPGILKNFFVARDTFYWSEAYDGNTLPQAGDIFFWGTNLSNPNHVGIVERVSDGYIYTIEGNWSNSVTTRVISVSNSGLIGYGRPQYTGTGHSYHVQGENDESTHCVVCDICGENNVSAHTYSSEYYANGNHHWRLCECGHMSPLMVHKFQYDSTLGRDKCKVCGYIDFGSIAPPRMLSCLECHV